MNRAQLLDPFHRTPEEIAAEASLFLENLARYTQQSAETKAGAPAELPPRPAAHRHLSPAP